MRTHQLGLLSADGATGEAALDVRGVDAARRGVAPAGAEDAVPLAPGEREQIARDIAEIERATMALRQAEPTLETWNHPPAPMLGQPRPVWLIVGVLWVSTALVTLGAVVAIARMVG